MECFGKGEHSLSEGVPEVLVDELKAYEHMKEELLKKYEGKVVVIKGGEVVGVYDSEEEAFRDIVERFDPIPVLIKCVTREERVEYIPAYTYGLLTAVIE